MAGRHASPCCIVGWCSTWTHWDVRLQFSLLRKTSSFASGCWTLVPVPKWAPGAGHDAHPFKCYRSQCWRSRTGRLQGSCVTCCCPRGAGSVLGRKSTPCGLVGIAGGHGAGGWPWPLLARPLRRRPGARPGRNHNPMTSPCGRRRCACAMVPVMGPLTMPETCIRSAAEDLIAPAVEFTCLQAYRITMTRLKEFQCTVAVHETHVHRERLGPLLTQGVQRGWNVLFYCLVLRSLGQPLNRPGHYVRAPDMLDALRWVLDRGTCPNQAYQTCFKQRQPWEMIASYQRRDDKACVALLCSAGMWPGDGPDSCWRRWHRRWAKRLWLA